MLQSLLLLLARGVRREQSLALDGIVPSTNRLEFEKTRFPS
jgi:hypothetical protein